MRSFAQFHQNLRGSAPSPAKAFAPPPVVVLDPRVEDLRVQVESVATSQAEVSQDISQRVDDLQTQVSDISDTIVPRVDALETKVDEVIEAVTPVSPPPPPPDPVDPVDPVVVGEVVP